MLTDQQIREWATPPSRDNDLSAKTYNSIKATLEKEFWDSVEIFLQGSYANATNIRKDSDIDIVLCYKKTYFYNIDNLSEVDQQRFNNSVWSRGRDFMDFKDEVERFLKTTYWSHRVQRKNKCIAISKQSNLFVDADIIPCFEYRRYHRYSQIPSQYDYYAWTNFITDEGDFIINFQKLHQKNGEAKNTRNDTKYKATVRVLKNINKYLVDQWLLEKKFISSFAIENLVYNISDGVFSNNDMNISFIWQIVLQLYQDMEDKKRYREYEEICGLFYLLRWGRIKETPENIIIFLQKALNLFKK